MRRTGFYSRAVCENAEQDVSREFSLKKQDKTKPKKHVRWKYLNNRASASIEFTNKVLRVIKLKSTFLLKGFHLIRTVNITDKILSLLINIVDWINNRYKINSRAKV